MNVLAWKWMKLERGFVASNVKSLAEAKVNPNLFPLAIYDAKVTGYEKPQLSMVGFTMYEITAGVGFILRLMIDHKYQRQGYGRATILEVIRRLKLYPDVEVIATSYQRGNEAVANLYRNLGLSIGISNGQRDTNRRFSSNWMRASKKIETPLPKRQGE